MKRVNVLASVAAQRADLGPIIRLQATVNSGRPGQPRTFCVSNADTGEVYFDVAAHPLEQTARLFLRAGYHPETRLAYKDIVGSIGVWGADAKPGPYAATPAQAARWHPPHRSPKGERGLLLEWYSNGAIRDESLFVNEELRTM